jgi:multimeric flavodoxin WrbA
LNVLAIAGSPRRGSNTDILLAEVLKGAVSRGAVIKTDIVANLNVMPCQACDTCFVTGQCPFLDDAQKVFQDMAWADRIVLAAPLHFMGLPSQVKTLVDRAQYLWARRYVLKLAPFNDARPRRGLFVSVGGRHGENVFAGAEVTVKAFFASADIKYAGLVAFPGIDKRAEIINHPEALKEAFVAGQMLVEP